MTTRKVRHNTRWSLWYQAFNYAALGVPTVTIYYHSIGLTQLQIHLMQATWAVVATILTVPCGYLADKFGVRRTILAASTCAFVQSTLFVFCRSFWQFEMLFILIGIVTALSNGTLNSLMTLTLKTELTTASKEDRDEVFSAYQRRALIVTSISATLMSIVGGLVADTWGLIVPYLFQPVMPLCMVVAAWRLEEPRGRIGLPPAFDAMRKTIRILLFDRPDTRWIIGANVMLYTTLIGGFWLFQPRLAELGIPLAAFGLIAAIRMALPGLMGLGGLVKRLQGLPDTRAWTIMLIAVTAGTVAISLPFGIFGVILTLVGFSTGSACRSVLLNDYLHKTLADERQRTTELSVVGAIETLMLAATLPLWGWLKDSTSTQTAYLMLGVACAVMGSMAVYRFRQTQPP